jgi:hypothetical protein
MADPGWMDPGRGVRGGFHFDSGEITANGAVT